VVSAAGAGTGAVIGLVSAPEVSDGRDVPSIRIDAPQRLHAILTRLPRTLASGTAYFAGQLPHETFI
jgi:hypothetical protein